jgi:hypothetical protein
LIAKSFATFSEGEEIPPNTD